MPTYIYTCEACGSYAERVSTIAKMKKSILCKCGKRAPRDMVAEQSQTVHHPGNWPKLSDALGVAPSQIKEAMAHAEANGCPTNFTKDGRAILTSHKHQNALTVACGLFNRHGSYGDSAPKNWKGR